MPWKVLLEVFMCTKEIPSPSKKMERVITKVLTLNLFKTKRRKTNATMVKTMYDLDSDKPNQKDRNNKKIITRVK